MSDDVVDLGAPWDERARPTLGEPDDATYPPGRLAYADHLVEVHDMLRGELTQLRDLIDQVRRGAMSVGEARSGLHTMTLRHNNWTLGAYCASYCRILTTHHTGEDTAIFPHLRAAEPAVAPVVDRLQEEHDVIHVLLDRLDVALVALVGEDLASEGDQVESGALDALEEAVDLLADSLLSHLAYEERELRGPLARHGFY